MYGACGRCQKDAEALEVLLVVEAKVRLMNANTSSHQRCVAASTLLVAVPLAPPVPREAAICRKECQDNSKLEEDLYFLTPKHLHLQQLRTLLQTPHKNSWMP